MVLRDSSQIWTTLPKLIPQYMLPTGMVNKRMEANYNVAELHTLVSKSQSQHPGYRKCLPLDHGYLIYNASNVLCFGEFHAQIGLWL